MKHIFAAGLIGFTILVSAAGSAAPSQNGEPGYGNCVSIDTTSNNLTAFLVNKCNLHLNVQWTDHGDCANWKCAVDIAANGKQSVGHFTPPGDVAACKWPIVPTVGSSGYGCVPIGSQSGSSPKQNGGTAVAGSAQAGVMWLRCDINATDTNGASMSIKVIVGLDVANNRVAGVDSTSGATIWDAARFQPAKVTWEHTFELASDQITTSYSIDRRTLLYAAHTPATNRSAAISGEGQCRKTQSPTAGN